MKLGSLKESKTFLPKEKTVSSIPMADRIDMLRSACWAISSLWLAGIREGMKKAMGMEYMPQMLL